MFNENKNRCTKFISRSTGRKAQDSGKVAKTRDAYGRDRKSVRGDAGSGVGLVEMLQIIGDESAESEATWAEAGRASDAK
jgi:hypothetical protein